MKLVKYYDSGRYYNNNPDDSCGCCYRLLNTGVIDHKLEWILKIAEKSKFLLRSTDDMTIRLPVDYLHAMGWEINTEVEISSAFWDKEMCHKIQIELVKKPNRKGKWSK